MAHPLALKSDRARGADGATERLVAFVDSLQWDALDKDVQHAAKRHLFDTVGVMIAGAVGDVATKAEAVLATIRPAGHVPVPGRTRRADVLDAAMLGGTGGHGIELDDGYRQGSVHPGVAVVPAIWSAAYGQNVSGTKLLEAAIAGYETVTSVARTSHPDLRRRGFHPTGVVGSLGAAMASGRLLGLSRPQLSHALGLAASASAGLFAFLGGGGDVKRLHAGHAAREGLFSALLAKGDVAGPPGILETSDGFFQAFATGKGASPRSFDLPPAVASGITDCYVKPYACCRHLQPAVEALMALKNEHGIDESTVESIDVETYGIAAEHAQTGWSDFASAQLSFPFIMALGLRFGRIDLSHFGDEVRCDKSIASICERVHVSVSPELDRTYPDKRPARVTLRTSNRIFTRSVDEALGSSTLPLDDAGLEAKFIDLVGPVLGLQAAHRLSDRLWSIDTVRDVTSLIDDTAQPHNGKRASATS
jgi:2-methylcitrate dehydratase PrpD